MLMGSDEANGIMDYGKLDGYSADEGIVHRRCRHDICFGPSYQECRVVCRKLLFLRRIILCHALNHAFAYRQLKGSIYNTNNNPNDK